MQQIFPEPTVGALIFNSKGELFLMASPAWNGKYVIPGGHIELGERLEDALKREIKEETNLDIFDINFLCFIEFIYGKNFQQKKHFLFIDYVCKTNDSYVALNEEGTDYIWISPEKALHINTEEYTQKAIKKYLNNLLIK